MNDLRPPQDEDGVSHVSEKDRAAVRQLIVELMLRSPEQVQRQLSDAISVIGRCDFPARWPNLIGDLTSRFSSGQFTAAETVQLMFIDFSSSYCML